MMIFFVTHKRKQECLIFHVQFIFRKKINQENCSQIYIYTYIYIYIYIFFFFFFQRFSYIVFSWDLQSMHHQSSFTKMYIRYWTNCKGWGVDTTMLLVFTDFALELK